MRDSFPFPTPRLHGWNSFPSSNLCLRAKETGRIFGTKVGQRDGSGTPLGHLNPMKSKAYRPSVPNVPCFLPLNAESCARVRACVCICTVFHMGHIPIYNKNIYLFHIDTPQNRCPRPVPKAPQMSHSYKKLPVYSGAAQSSEQLQNQVFYLPVYRNQWTSRKADYLKNPHVKQCHSHTVGRIKNG